MNGNVIEQNSSYRRGLVLGLTMAEIVLLIIFILLLVLGTLLTLQKKERRELETKLKNQEISYARMEDRFRQILAVAKAGDPDELFLELRRASKFEAEVKRMKSRLTEMEGRQMRAEAVFKVLQDTKLPTAADELAEAIAEFQTAKETLDEVGGDGVAEIVTDNRRLAQELDNKTNQITNLRQRLQGAGAGTDHPPCWATPEGKPEYIFDVALTSRGLLVRDRVLRHRTEEKMELPVTDITFATELAPQRFLSQTDAIYRWSMAHKCRFFVFAFDLTEPGEKATYKRHMRTLEQHFYKYEVRDDPF